MQWSFSHVLLPFPDQAGSDTSIRILVEPKLMAGMVMIGYITENQPSEISIVLRAQAIIRAQSCPAIVNTCGSLDCEEIDVIHSSEMH